MDSDKALLMGYCRESGLNSLLQNFAECVKKNNYLEGSRSSVVGFACLRKDEIIGGFKAGGVEAELEAGC